ncbi:MAG: hypothetical protein ACRC50_05290 [Gaiella sp.]
MEAVLLLAIVVLVAVALVLLLVGLLGQSGERAVLGRVPRRARRRRSHVRGGLLVAVVGTLMTLVFSGGWATNGYRPCEADPHRSDWTSVKSPGSAVAITSSVLEFESGTGGLFCENERMLKFHVRARPSDRKPIFLGVAGVTAARRYLGASRYEVAASYFALFELRRVGRSIRRLAPPEDAPFWRSSVVFPVHGADAVARLSHEWRAVGAEPFAGPRFGTPPAERFWLVVMNTDGSPRVAADVRYEVGLAPSARWRWLVGIAAGIGLVVTGMVLAVRRPDPGHGGSSAPSSTTSNPRGWWARDLTPR